MNRIMSKVAEILGFIFIISGLIRTNLDIITAGIICLFTSLFLDIKDVIDLIIDNNKKNRT